MSTSRKAKKKVFISYSWSGFKLKELAMKLAKDLRANGVEVILDEWDLKLGQDVNVFMERMVADPSVSKVLILCDREYKEKADNRKGGVGAEVQIFSPHVYADVYQTKFIPVVCELGENVLPVCLESRAYATIADYQYDKGLEDLLRDIYDEPRNKKPPLGKPPVFKKSERDSLETDAPQQTTQKAQQKIVAPQAAPAEPLIVVSFVLADLESAKKLLECLKERLSARTDDLAKQIKFWNYTDDLRPGVNASPTIQDAFKRASMGLLLVSPSACASNYIKEHEWPHFRDHSGNILKPFVPVLLDPVDPKTHDLGVLGEKGQNGRTQLFHLHHKGESCTWNECKEAEALKNAFIENLINEILYLKQTPALDGSPSSPSSEKQKYSRKG